MSSIVLIILVSILCFGVSAISVSLRRDGNKKRLLIASAVGILIGAGLCISVAIVDSHNENLYESDNSDEVLKNYLVNKALGRKLNPDDSILTKTQNIAVDLGLPSGTKWASHNVGATYPYEEGGFYEENSSALSAIDSIYGKGWKLPSDIEIDELIGYCKWKWCSFKEKPGYLVTGPNKNYIFLPTTGLCYGYGNGMGEDEIEDENYYGYYLGDSCQVHVENPYIWEPTMFVFYGEKRYQISLPDNYKCKVRPVYIKNLAE